MEEKSDIQAQIEALDAAIAQEATADAYYQRGRLHWRAGNRGAAMSDYNRAVALDPDSPAAEALKLCNEIMDFYNTDLYNP